MGGSGTTSTVLQIYLLFLVKIMKIIYGLVILNILLIFTVCVSGQKETFPNELKGFELYQKGKLKEIKLLVSNEKDIKKVFGTNCHSGCDYNEDWTVSFSLIRKGDHISETDEKGKEQKFYPERKYVGTLTSIRFHPNRSISIENTAFSSSFRQIVGNSGIPNQKDAIPAVIFMDMNGLQYNLSLLENSGAKHEKGNVISIEYAMTEDKREEIFGITRYYEKKNQQ